MFMLSWQDTETFSELGCGTVAGQLNSLYILYAFLKHDGHKYHFTLIGPKGIIEPNNEKYINVIWYYG